MEQGTFSDNFACEKALRTVCLHWDRVPNLQFWHSVKPKIPALLHFHSRSQRMEQSVWPRTSNWAQHNVRTVTQAAMTLPFLFFFSLFFSFFDNSWFNALLDNLKEVIALREYVPWTGTPSHLSRSQLDHNPLYKLRRAYLMCQVCNSNFNADLKNSKEWITTSLPLPIFVEISSKLFKIPSCNLNSLNSAFCPTSAPFQQVFEQASSLLKKFFDLEIGLCLSLRPFFGINFYFQ